MSSATTSLAGELSSAITSGIAVGASSSIPSEHVSGQASRAGSPRRSSLRVPKSRCNSARVLSNSNLLDPSAIMSIPSLLASSNGASRIASIANTMRDRDEERDAFNAEDLPLPPPLVPSESPRPPPLAVPASLFGPVLARRCSLPSILPSASSDEAGGGGTGRESIGPPVRRGRAELARNGWKHGVLHAADINPSALLQEMEELADVPLIPWEDASVANNLRRLCYSDVVPPLEMDRVLNPRPLARPDLVKLRRYSGASGSLNMKRPLQLRASREELESIPFFRNRSGSLPDHIFAAERVRPDAEPAKAEAHPPPEPAESAPAGGPTSRSAKSRRSARPTSAPLTAGRVLGEAAAVE